MDDELARDIAEGLNQGGLQDRFHAAGVRPMLRNALEKAAVGVTSINEVLALHRPEVKGKRRTLQVH